MEFFATAAKGTEPALRDELRWLRIPGVRCDRGGVHFGGEFPDAFRVCLWSRVALRVLLPLARFPAPDKESLYQGVYAVDWEPYLTPRHTLAVTAFCKDSALTHTNFTAQKVKDAIVDQQRSRHGVRPDVDRDDPDVHLFLHLLKNRATLYLDLAGESLHRRGYRMQPGEAPLKENLAAALLRLIGWNRRTPFCDPMCGSGTLAIEAALLAADRAPGLARRRFGFERWPLFSDNLRRKMAELREEARAAIRRDPPPILASDIDPRAVENTRANARAAGVEIAVSRGSVLRLAPLSPPGLILTNPPYGKRIAAERKFFAEMGRVFAALSGHTVGVLSGDRAIQRAIPLKPEKSWTVFNGDLECRLIRYRID